MKKTNQDKLIAYLTSRGILKGAPYASGKPLPSMRQLAAQFKLSLTTTQRLVKKLCQSGLLECHNGSGTYLKNVVNSPSRRKIGVILHDSRFQTTYCSVALQGIQQEAKLHDCELELIHQYYEHLPFNYEQLKLQEYNALILLGCYDINDLSFLSDYLVVGLEIHTSLQGHFSMVTLDPFEAAQMAVSHFRDLGITSVTVITANMPVHQVRAQVFRDGFQGDVTVSDYSDVNIDMVVENHGYLFVSGTDYQDFAAKYFRKFHHRLAENPAVLTIDGKNLVIPDWEPANTIAIDWKRAGIVLAQECYRRLQDANAPAERIYILPELYMYDPSVGASVRAFS